MKIASVTSITSTDVVLYIFFMHKDTHTAVASVITALPYSQHPLHNGPLQDSSPAAVYDKMQASRRSRALACARRRHDVTRCNGMISTRPQRCKDYVTYETGSTVDNNFATSSVIWTTKTDTQTHMLIKTIWIVKKLLLDTLNSYVGWAKESGPQTHDHNSDKS